MGTPPPGLPPRTKSAGTPKETSPASGEVLVP